MNIKKYGWIAGGFVVCISLLALSVYLWQENEVLRKKQLQLDKKTDDGCTMSHYETELDQLYKADQYGGVTPQETLSLFIKSIEKENIKEASQYFLPELKDQAEKDLLKAKNEGHLKELISILKNLDRGSELYDGAYQFNAVDINGGEGYSVGFIRNPYSKKWKIEHF